MGGGYFCSLLTPSSASSRADADRFESVSPWKTFRESEAYRVFRGRAPSPEALFRKRGLEGDAR
jgi:hypothetical protein